MLAGVVVFGMLTWWWPGYRSWGALATGLLLVFGLWLMCRTVSADRKVPGHPIYIVLLGPAALLVIHLGRTGLGASDEPQALNGVLNVSMIFQLALLALGVMLTQSLLPRAAGHVAVLSVCGAAMIGGAAAALVWAQAEHVRSALSLVGFGGIGVWLAPLWGLGRDEARADSHGSHLRRLELRIGCVAVGVMAAVLLATQAWGEATVAGGVLAGTLMLSGIIFHHRRVVLLALGGFLAAVAGVIGLWTRPVLPTFQNGLVRAFGQGEGAFAHVSALDNGLIVLVGTIGWSGTLWLVAGLIICIVSLMWHARKGHPGDQRRAIVWTAATGTTSLALLASGGLFIPVVTLAVAFTWGLLPTMLGRPFRPRTGAVLLGLVVAVIGLMGLASGGGLVRWSTKAFGAGDKLLHGMAGFFLAMVLAWFLGARKLYLGVIGIVLSILAGGGGELLQGIITSRRAVEMEDWLAHAIGSAVAILPYLLCMGSRWCESPDARIRIPDSQSRYVRVD